MGCGPSPGCLEGDGKEAPCPPSLTILPLGENQAGVGQSPFTSVSVCLTIACILFPGAGWPWPASGPGRTPGGCRGDHLRCDFLSGLCPWAVTGGPAFLSSSFPPPSCENKGLGNVTGKKFHSTNIYQPHCWALGWILGGEQTPHCPCHPVLPWVGRGVSPVSKLRRNRED